MRSLPDIANERVKSLTSSISAIREDVMFKGFLGQTMREDRKLPSVGHRAARRAGIIIDENGKMRCPPGTPNANQFTDRQMTNCMVPSAETMAGAAAQAASSLLPDKTSPKLIAEFRALGIDIDDTLKKDKRRLTPEQKDIVKKLAWSAAYWATFFGNFGDIGTMINDATTGTNDSGANEGIEILTGMFVSGGMVSVKVALTNAKEKWNKTKEQVDEYQEAFAERMKRLRIKGGELSEKMQGSFNDVIKSTKERFRGINANEPTSLDRAVGAVDTATNAADLRDLPKAGHETSDAIKAFNAEVLAKAPRWGKPTDEDIKAINDTGYYAGKAVLTLKERQTARRTMMAEKVSNLRSMIESGVQTVENGFPFARRIDPKTHEFILTHTDDEVIAAIEQTALTIAKARKPEASVWAKGMHLEKYLADGYLPMSEGPVNPDAKVGDVMTSLLGRRGQYEAGVGAPSGSGVRPVYGFSGFTFWDDELKRITDEKNAKEGMELFSKDHYLSIPGKGGGIDGFEGAFAGNGSGYGDMEFVLHPEVADRTVMHHQDSILNLSRGTAAVGSSDEELVESIAGHLENGDMDDNINRLLRTHVTQDFVNWNKSSGLGKDGLNENGQYTESQILGGFTVQDIKEIKFDANRLFPKYKDQFNPDGVDGAELIQKIEDQHLSTEQLLAAGFTMGEIEVARAKISGWKTKNAQADNSRNRMSVLGEAKIDGLISAMEMERITSLVAEKAPNAKVIFGSYNGLDLGDPTKYDGGKAGDRITDIWGERVRKQLLEDVQRQIRYAAAPSDGESVS
jgi:hypothetical protein